MSAPGPSHLLYLHGFRSSPRSFKAVRLRQWLQQHRPDVHWWCPQLPPSPREALALVMARLSGWPAGRFAVLGSSLGGWYAGGVAEATGCPAVLLNPAVHPARDLRPFVGELTAYHDPNQRFEFKAAYLDEFSALQPPRLTRLDRYFAVIAKGDELLDWREMSECVQGAHLRLIEGSDHGLSDFDDHLPAILHFLQLTPTP